MKKFAFFRSIRLSYRSRKALMQLQSVHVAEIEDGKLKEWNTILQNCIFCKAIVYEKEKYPVRLENKIVSFSVNFN